MTSEELLEAESQKGETKRQRALCVRVESDREATQRGLSCGLRWRCAPLPRCPCAAALPCCLADAHAARCVAHKGVVSWAGRF